MSPTLAQSLRTDRIRELPLREVCSVAPATPIQEVIRKLTDQRTSCALVSDGGRVVGIFTERDFLDRVISRSLGGATPVSEVMTPSPRSVGRDSSVLSAVELMETGGYRHLPVVGDDGKPLGVLSVRDIVHYLVEYFPAQVYNLPPRPDQTPPAREGA